MVLLRSGHGLGGLGYAATLPCRQPWAAPHLALQRPQSTRTAWVGRPLVRRLGVAVAASRLGRRRSLRCTARLTSSRDSLDEEQLEGLLPQGHQNGRPSAAAGSRDTAAAAAAASPLAPPQCAVDVPACGEAWQARQLSIKELQKLTELHIEDAYRCGVVSCAPELAACLGTNLSDGLCESQVELEQRAQRYGCNSVRPPREVTFLELVQEALQDFTILVLLGAGCLSLGLEVLVNQHSGGESSWIEGASILAAVALVVLVTAVNNYQKERQFRMLQAVSADVKVRAIRHGREQALPVAEVVVGDLVLVETGDILCTDGVLVAGCDVKVDESHLTGESDDVAKDPLARPSLLGGSKVLSGFGRMLVTAVGPHSQSGAIAEMVADGKAAAAAAPPGAGDGLREETLLQRKLAEYATSIGRFGLGAAAVAWAAMTARFSVETFVLQQQAWDWAFLQDYLRFFITGVTILVVAVPEGLPLAVTLALAFSVRRMLADHNLVRHLSAAETMGTATVVCSDKTGTLTQNDMVVSKLWLAGHLLPDLKPYTRHERRPEAQQQRWLGAASGSSGSSGAGCASASSGSGAGSGSADLPPLAELLLSRDSVASLGGAGSGSSGSLGGEEASPVSSRASILDSITAGSSTPTDIVQLLVESVALNSTANIIREDDGTTRSIGNRTEVALLELGVLLGGRPRALRRQQRQLAQVSFSSERKRMTTACLPPGTRPHPDGSALCRIYTKGASEIVLERCSYVLAPDGTRRRLGDEEKAALLGDFTQGGQRVLCLAYRDITLPPEVLSPPGSSIRVTSEGSSSSEEGGGAGRGAMGGDPHGWLWDTASSLNARGTSSGSDDDAAPWDGKLCLADNLESNLTLLALVGIEDPLREEVPAAILQCQASGITVKMLTGDNVGTATAIAQECGILPPAGASLEDWSAAHAAAKDATRAGVGWFRDDPSSSIVSPQQKKGEGSLASRSSLLASVGSLDAHRPACGEAGGEACGHGGLPEGVVMEGAEFRERVLNPDGSINADEFLSIWPRLRVLARCTPADKYTIVTGVRSLTKDVVAVTGDGTNDAPALRAANVGFAMNVGTDTAKEAADIVLLDNNFASIVSAVLWGRNVYANITRFLQFQLTINLVAVATAVTGAVVAAESPLTAVQMLWVNMIMDSLASLALATEPPDPRILSIPPFSQEHEFVDPATPTVKHIAGQAAYQLAVMYGLIFYAPALLGIPDHAAVVGPSEHYTLVFNTFVFMQLFNQMNARKILDSSQAWEGLGSARWFQWILGSELLLQILIVQFGGQWFNTHPLDAREWGVCVGLGATTLLLREILRRLPYGRRSEYGT